MMALRKLHSASALPGFWRQEEGAVLAEALLAVPFVTLFAAGILEFGNIFWQSVCRSTPACAMPGATSRDARPVSGTYVPNAIRRPRKRSPFTEPKVPLQALNVARARLGTDCRHHGHPRQC